MIDTSERKNKTLATLLSYFQTDPLPKSAYNNPTSVFYRSDISTHCCADEAVL